MLEIEQREEDRSRKTEVSYKRKTGYRKLAKLVERVRRKLRTSDFGLPSLFSLRFQSFQITRFSKCPKIGMLS